MVKKVREKIVEYFKVKVRGKEKTIKKTAVESSEEKPTKKQISEENKILGRVFGVLGILILVVIGSYLVMYNASNFEYKGMEFSVVKVGEVVWYTTSFTVTSEGKYLEYPVYLRNDPRKLEKEIPFQGEIRLPEVFVLENTESFSCDGDGGISMRNLQRVLNVFDTEFITDENATCDPQGRYGHMKIQSGNLSAIAQIFGPSCYILQVNNCEILKVTERFLVETLVKELGEE